MRFALQTAISVAWAAWVTGPEVRSAPVDFVKDIQPILAEHCYQCHGPKRSESGLRLDHKGSAMRGGDHGPVIVPRDASGSVLVRAIRRTDAKLKMPKKGEPLDSEQIDKIVTWISQGAPWPDAASGSLVPK